MTALARERATKSLDSRWTRFMEPLPLEDAVKCYAGGLAGYYHQGALIGEVAPFDVNANMIGIGRFTKTVDNADDGESVVVECGAFIWGNSAEGDAITSDHLGKFAWGQDDQTVGILPYVATTDPVINTITPTAANATRYTLRIRWKKPGELLWRTTTIGYTSDADGTATEICDGLRADLVLKTELTGFVTGTGTATLILTGAEGVQFDCAQIGTGVLAVVVTDAGTITERSRAGLILDVSSAGPVVLSHPAIYGGLLV